MVTIPAGAVVTITATSASVGVRLARWEGQAIYVFREDVEREAVVAGKCVENKVEMDKANLSKAASAG